MDAHAPRRTTDPERHAAHAGYSERSFIRRFHAETGLPLLRWLHGQRVQKARRLLERTDSDLEAVASATGIRDRRHLTPALRSRARDDTERVPEDMGRSPGVGRLSAACRRTLLDVASAVTAHGRWS